MNTCTDNPIAIKDNRLRTFFAMGLLFSTLLISNTLFAEVAGYKNQCKENNPFLHCEEINRICQQVKSIASPIEDKPTEQEKQKLKGCISAGLYYGNSSDPIKARKCAYLQIEEGRLDGPFDGVPILMRVYVNGEGVKPNLGLALKFACEDEGGAAAEYEGRIFTLNQFRQAGDTHRSFDYCDDVTSGLMQGYCTARDAEIEKGKRGSKLAELVSSWPKHDKQEFEKLRAVWQRFLETSEVEVDQMGTARVALVIEHAELLEQNFVSSITKFNRGELPSYSDNDFIRADSEMNLIYKSIQKKTGDQSSWWGTVTKDNIKITQRAWLKFRDAWVTFAKQKYPSVPAVAWKTWLTRERVEQLKSFTETL